MGSCPSRTAVVLAAATLTGLSLVGHGLADHLTAAPAAHHPASAASVVHPGPAPMGNTRSVVTAGNTWSATPMGNTWSVVTAGNTWSATPMGNTWSVVTAGNTWSATPMGNTWSATPVSRLA